MDIFNINVVRSIKHVKHVSTWVFNIIYISLYKKKLQANKGANYIALCNDMRALAKL